MRGAARRSVWHGPDVSDAIEDGLAEVVAMVEPGARLLRVWTLAGGLSATMTLLEVQQADGTRRRLVVRRARSSHSDVGSLTVADECRVLVRLRALGLRVPRPRSFDESGNVLDQPYAVLDYIEGTPRFTTPDPVGTARTFAVELAAIHQVDGSRSDFADLPRRAEVIGTLLSETGGDIDGSLSEDVIRDVLRAHWPPPEPDRLSLLHGDFWPGNVLWADEDIVAVLDWEDASVGDPLADVGTTRLDLLWAFGPRAMSAFTDEYVSLRSADPTHLALWDLVAALRPAGALSSWAADWAVFGRPDVTAATMRAAHQSFLAQALAVLRGM